MKTTNSCLAFIFVLIWTCVSPLTLQAYSLRQFSSKNGLSNSAILSMCQDHNGFVWFGSCDGLNMFDGINFQIYKPTNSRNNLSGNLIESLFEAEHDIFWVQTNYGLDRFDSRNRTITTFREFKGNNKLFQSPEHDIYIVKEDNYLHYYAPDQETFFRIYIEDLLYEEIMEITIDTENTLWIFSKNGRYWSYTILRDKNGVSLIPRNYFTHDREVVFCFYEDHTFYLIDDSYALYEYDALEKKKMFIKNIRREIEKYGDIYCMLKYHDDYFIGFRSTGLIRLQKNETMGFTIHEIDIKSGVFCLMKDRFQDILWVGTDGQGVYMYYIDSYSIKTTLFTNIPYAINNPVRALHLDAGNTLWVATKGDGIIALSGYDVLSDTWKGTQQHLVSNSALTDNSVYSFAPSNKNVLWIGTENGMNYYSYRDKTVKSIEVMAGNQPLSSVHSICEFNDSTLWVATVGAGFVKVKLNGTADNPVLTNGQRFVFQGGRTSLNYFFTSYKENDSIVWFGNRGYGAYRINNNTHEVNVYTFDDEDTNQTVNDVFAIEKTEKGYWFGTSYGLAYMNEEQKELFNESTSGFPNNTVHGILQDRKDNLWLSTNRGIIKFNTLNNTFRTYQQQNELQVTEFSDGAFYKDEKTGTMFFGGINGFVTIRDNDYMQEEYEPSIQFNQLAIFGHDYNINDFYRNRETLTLNYGQNFFSLAFTAVDYINGSDYTYFYRLGGLSNNWIENGSSNRASFTNISPGHYTLQVKYRNNITGKESSPHLLSIRILPPWYGTVWAYIIYALLGMAILTVIVYLSIRWYRLKRVSMIEKLNRQRKEEVYESKLRFFTNITHELCTPLTLIYGPCERIISYPQADGYVTKYAGIIRHNAEKLNGLIQELIEFRRLETGNKKADIHTVPVSELVRNIAESFSELAESKGFDYRLNVAGNIVWNSDKSFLSKIVTNLISNAFKYTFEQGSIVVGMEEKEEQLHISISNTGKGIKQEDISRIFDRYKILDNFENQTGKGISPRNGLGLAICHSLVQLLDGDIRVTSELNGLTVFTVVLPRLQANPDSTPKAVLPETIQLKPDVVPVRGELPAYDRAKQTILIIDDDPNMLWFITEIFIGKFNVIPINDSKEVAGVLKTHQPDLIISDVMMPDIDGISLAKSIKSDKMLSHIPLIMLSAKNDVEARVEGIESGAEVYMSKPFHVEYLEKVVNRLLRRKEELKEYYSSVYSSVEVDKGRILSKEDKEFFDKMLLIIDENIENPDLNVELLSSLLGVSPRQLYRRLKSITEKTPNDIIREFRLTTAEKLLITTHLSVDEILYKAGFTNRGNFFKAFARQYGMTPKKYREQKRTGLEMKE